jgi:hypothetical protein
MRSDSVRVSLDLPRDLHRRVHELAARKGCSARQLILQSIEQTVAAELGEKRKKRLCLDPPIVRSAGKPFDLSNREIYDLIEFP